MMVGFIEPVGTSFQSAIAERKANSTRIVTSSGLASSLRNFRHRSFQEILDFMQLRST